MPRLFVAPARHHRSLLRGPMFSNQSATGAIFFPAVSAAVGGGNGGEDGSKRARYLVEKHRSTQASWVVATSYIDLTAQPRGRLILRLEAAATREADTAAGSRSHERG